MRFFILLLLSFEVIAAPTAEVNAAKESIRSLIAPMLPGGPSGRPKGTEKFRVDGCEKYNINWKNVLLMKETPTLRYEFKEGCDVQGTIQPRVFKPFPASLDVRNLMDFNHLQTENKITSTLEAKPILNLDIMKGVLKGKKGKVRFEADYKVRINPVNKEKAVEENIGGEIRITEIYGVKVSIKEKIKVE